MGNDGGSLPHREDLIKEKPKEKKVDKTMHAFTKSRFCTLTSQPLRKPLVADRIGNLFNKESILEALITKKMSKAYCYIKKIKDVIDVNPTLKVPGCDVIGGDSVNIHNKTAQSESSKKSQPVINTIICPLTKLELDGFHKFSLLWSCGCIFATQIIENIQLNHECPNCGKSFKDKDIIDLTPDPVTLEQQRKALVEKVVLKKIEKREAKEVNKEETEQTSSTRKRKREEEVEEQKIPNKRQKTVDVDEIIQKEIDEDWKRKVKVVETKFKDIGDSKSQLDSNGKKLNCKTFVEQKVNDKLQKDETFKSLFNDHSKENKEQDFLCRSGYGMS